MNYRNSEKTVIGKEYPIQFYSVKKDENLSLIKSGFFEKDLEIKRI